MTSGLGLGLAAVGCSCGELGGAGDAPTLGPPAGARYQKKNPRVSAQRDTTIAAMQLITEIDPTPVFDNKPPGREYG
jgi:hypothetical protein